MFFYSKKAPDIVNLSLNRCIYYGLIVTSIMVFYAHESTLCRTKAFMKTTKNLRFVVQQHDATHMHYDFRLEINGVLVSWAVPKGPSMDPSVKRLALQTPDHALEYGSFEGILPEGSYGAGPVLLWDEGTYESIKEVDGKVLTPAQSLEMGTLEFKLHGKKLRGNFALIKTKGMRGHSSKNQWLFIKMHDEYAQTGDITKEMPESVKSGKKISKHIRAKKSSAK